MTRQGDNPSTASTFGRPILGIDCREYVLIDSKYSRCASAKIVSKASEDFPEPDTPVITTNWFRGMVTVMFFRLCSLQPITLMFTGNSSLGLQGKLDAHLIILIRLFQIRYLLKVTAFYNYQMAKALLIVYPLSRVFIKLYI